MRVVEKSVPPKVPEKDSYAWLVATRRLIEELLVRKSLGIADSEMLDYELLRQVPELKMFFHHTWRGEYDEALLELHILQDPLENELQKTMSGYLIQFQDMRLFARGGTASYNTSSIPQASKLAKARSVPNRSAPEGSSISGRRLHVIALDSGTWPLDGGGVASCRKLIINLTHERIYWHGLFETNMPKPLPVALKSPQHVLRLCMVPNFSPNLCSHLESFLSYRSHIWHHSRYERTTAENVNRYFIPHFRTFVRLLSRSTYSPASLQAGAYSISEIWLYFKVFSWQGTWDCGLVHAAWAEEWCRADAEDLSSYMAGALNGKGNADHTDPPLLSHERPCMYDLDHAMDLISHFLTSLLADQPAVPNETIVHCTHHGPQSLFGVALKHNVGAGFCVWDHGVTWREQCKALIELESESQFVRRVLVGVLRLSGKLAMFSADIICPCNKAFNCEWEERILVSGELDPRDKMGLLTNYQHRISPVLNGQEAMKDSEIVFNKPKGIVTAVMLSHVYALKDIMNAILSADVIVNTYKIDCYQLKVYGGLDKDLAYVARCRAVIEGRKLSNNVFLMGAGKPAAVLAEGDIFLNSSISEGLPMALIEAGFAGLPVAVTDAGGTRDVAGPCAVVPPQNPIALGEAIINTLACDSRVVKDFTEIPQIDWEQAKGEVILLSLNAFHCS